MSKATVLSNLIIHQYRKSISIFVDVNLVIFVYMSEFTFLVFFVGKKGKLISSWGPNIG